MRGRRPRENTERRAVSAGQSAPVVAIVGRPNAGKSTLFNRLVRAPRAVVDPAPGVTRDRNEAQTSWSGHPLRIVDTGGIEGDVPATEPLIAAVRAQSLRATRDADAIIALFDGRGGFTPLDRALVRELRRCGKPVFYAVNKLDVAGLDDEAADFFRLGVDRVYAISAAHGRGIDDLLSDVVAALPAETGGEQSAGAAAEIALAIVGRPNVGKSSLLNRLVGEERAIVSPLPGTTRDAVDSSVTLNGQRYLLIDTAGIRRRPRVQEGVERASVARALRALERAEVALVVIDGNVPMTEQDARITGYAWERGRGLLLVVNKWDLVPKAERSEQRFRETLAWRFPSLASVPVVFVSAHTGAGVERIPPALERLTSVHRCQMQTARINQVIEQAVRAQAPASVQGKRPVFYYATQTGNAPPIVTVFTSNPALVQPAYERYLCNQLCDAFELRGTPLQVRFRARPRQDRGGARRRAK
jgi:GTP-binding protein